uniref:hypothetical protein n=1 Tax=Klebsiella pneumoniae TaxID=573 RepID=UPI0013D76CDE
VQRGQVVRSRQHIDQSNPWRPAKVPATIIAPNFSTNPSVDGTEVTDILTLGRPYGAPVKYLMIPTIGGQHGAARR